MSEIAPGIHRIEEDLGPRFMAQYLLTGSERTLLVDTGLSQTLTEAIAPYAESIGIAVEAIDELFVSHADVDHIGSNRALRERSPRTRVSCWRARSPLGRVERGDPGRELPLVRALRVHARPQRARLHRPGARRRRARRPRPHRRRDVPARPGRALGGARRCPATRSATWASGTPRSGRRSSSTPCSATASSTAPGSCCSRRGSTTCPGYRRTIERVRALRPELLLTAHYPVMGREEAEAFLFLSLGSCDDVLWTTRRRRRCGASRTCERSSRPSTPASARTPSSPRN